MTYSIALLPGDGVGPEVTSSAVKILEAVAFKFGHTFVWKEYPIGGIAIDTQGVPLAEETLNACRASDAVLLGAVGGPKWDDPSAKIRPEQGLLAIRKGMKLFANLRPVKIFSSLLDASPVKPDRLKDVDIIVVRELTGGLYFGIPKGREIIKGRERAFDTLEYYDYEIERVVRLAFELAKNRKKKVTSVDKANVLESSRLWRQTVVAVAKEYPGVLLDHMLVDTASMRLISSPSQFDVIVTENMFGDILTDEASVLSGSMGLLPSASIGVSGPGLYEPIHGSAPDIAGKGIANPVGTILSAALLLRYSLSLPEEAAAVESAVDRVINSGARTIDLGGNDTTEQITKKIMETI